MNDVLATAMDGREREALGEDWMNEIPEDEARAIMRLPKWGEPMREWRQHRGHAHTITNAFGVVDEDGATIPGLVVEFLVYRAPRIVMERYVYSLFKDELGARKRVYQLHINHKPRVRPTDHEYSHEHIGVAPRIVASADWAALSPVAAEKRFCVNCNLTLRPRLPDFDAYTLE